jgi:hypothetical protein
MIKEEPSFVSHPGAVKRFPQSFPERAVRVMALGLVQRYRDQASMSISPAMTTSVTSPIGTGEFCQVDPGIHALCAIARRRGQPT